jgi:pilus assembly protein Flp/PilA
LLTYNKDASFEAWELKRLLETKTKENGMLNKLLAFKNAYLTKEDGATAIEYGLIAAGISIAILSAVFLLGDNLRDLFDTIVTALGTAGDNVDTGGL